MRVTTLCIASFAALVAAAAVLAPPADAAPKKRTAEQKPVPVTLATPPRARITVQRRTFLEGGPQVLPGTDPATYYIWTSPNQFPGDVLQNTTFMRPQAVPGPGFLPDRNNPWPYFWCSGC